MRILAGLTLIIIGMSIIYYTYKKPNKFLPTGNARAYLVSVGFIVVGFLLIFNSNFHVLGL